MTYRNLLSMSACIGALTVVLGAATSVTAQEASGEAGTQTRQTDTSADTAQLEDIIVTARKVRERLQDAPVSVTTLTGQTLETRGIRDLAEVVKLASSVKFDSDADVRAGISVRGVGQSSDVNAAPGVGLFIDGVYQPSSAYYTVPFFDVERIEILKGPQGTLYGKNTLGGAISIISRSPGDRMSANFQVEKSTGPQIVANGAVSVPIAGETFGNRTSVFYRYSEGLLTNRTTGEDGDKRRDFAVRSRFVLAPEGNFRSALALFYADLQAAPFPYSTTTRGLNDPINNVTKNINGLVESRYKGVNLSNSLDIGVATLTSLTSYDKGKVDTLGDADFTGTSALRVSGKSDRDTFAQELRLANTNGVKSNFRWLIGGYYNDDRLSSTNLSEANFGAIAGFRPLTSGAKRETGKTYAGFGQVTLTLDKLELLGGIRYDNEKRRNASNSLNGLTRVNTLFSARVVSKAWQPKVSISYHFTPDVMAYGLVTRGFRAGGFNAITAPLAFASYQPERTTNYESGLKTELFGHRVRLNAAGFYTDYKDILITDIVRGTDGSQTVISRNGGKARSYGGELDASWRVTRGLTLTGGYTYLDIKNKVIPAGLIRREVSGFARHNFNIQADYIQPIGNDMSIGAHASAAYIGRTPLGTEIEYRKAHTITDASLDLNVDTVTISLFGKNVFNEKYYTSYIPAASTALRTSALGLLNRPAEYGVRLTGRF